MNPRKTLDFETPASKLHASVAPTSRARTAQGLAMYTSAMAEGDLKNESYSALRFPYLSSDCRLSSDGSCTVVYDRSVSTHGRNWIRGDSFSRRYAVSGKKNCDGSNHRKRWREADSGNEITRLSRCQGSRKDRTVLRWNRGSLGGSTWADHNLRQLWHECIAAPIAANGVDS